MNATEQAEFLRDLVLTTGSHKEGYGYCVQEAVAALAGEPHSYRPRCSPPTVGAACPILNDANWSSDAARTEAMRPLLLAQIGSRSTPEIETRRAFVAADWAVRRLAPIALDKAGLVDQATLLRNLPPITGVCTARAAADAAVYAARAAADAPVYAARAARAAADAATRAACAAAGAADAAADAAVCAAVCAAGAAGAAGAARDGILRLGVEMIQSMLSVEEQPS